MVSVYVPPGSLETWATYWSSHTSCRKDELTGSLRGATSTSSQTCHHPSQRFSHRSFAALLLWLCPSRHKGHSSGSFRRTSPLWAPTNSTWPPRWAPSIHSSNIYLVWASRKVQLWVCVCVCLGGEVSFELISCENIWSGSDGNWPPEAIWGSMCQRALIRMCLSPFSDQKNTPVMHKTSLAAVCLVFSQPETLTDLFCKGRSNKWSYNTNIY